jgi:C4-dicarboxylate transporter DctM subunit
MISFVLATCAVYSFILSAERIGDVLNAFLFSVTDSSLVVFLIIMGLVLLLGCFMDMLAATIVLVPILHPIALAYGIDPIQFGVVFCIGCIIGGVTPPVGNVMFIAMGLAKTTIGEMARYLFPGIGLMAIVIVICILFPGVVTAIPNFVM